MKNIIRPLFPLFYILTISVAQSGLDIAKKLDKKERPQSVFSRISMVLTNSKNKSRENILISKSNNIGKNQIIWVLEPKSDRGISFLRKEYESIDNEIRMWLPAFNKIRRINSNRMSDSFMGSDLSYEDLNSRVLSDNNYERLNDELFNGIDCYVLKVISKPELKSAYSKHTLWVSKKNLTVLKEQSFGKNNELKKVKIFSYKLVKNYELASKILVQDIQKNHKTEVYIDYISINKDVNSRLFRESSLKRIPRL